DSRPGHELAGRCRHDIARAWATAQNIPGLFHLPHVAAEPCELLPGLATRRRNIDLPKKGTRVARILVRPSPHQTNEVRLGGPLSGLFRGRTDCKACGNSNSRWIRGPVKVLAIDASHREARTFDSSAPDAGLRADRRRCVECVRSKQRPPATGSAVAVGSGDYAYDCPTGSGHSTASRARRSNI